jgi:peptide/nickel transport system permease protein
MFISLFGDFIANDKPLYCKINEQSDTPAIRYLLSRVGLVAWTLEDAAGDWKTRSYQRVVFAPIPYSSQNIDLQNANFRGPFDAQKVKSTRYRHWLGTDHLGRDVLAGLIYGTRVALLVGLCSMLLAAGIGIPIGAMAGYLGDDRFRIGVAGLVISGIGILSTAYFFITALMTTGIASLLCMIGAIATIIIVIGIHQIFRRVRKVGKEIAVPVDSIVLRLIEILRSIPAFFLLFAILGMIPSPGLASVIFLIAILSSPSIIRFVRAEALKLRDQTFIQSARVIGLTDLKIIGRHIIPNAIGPALITIAFGMGSAVLIESALSFLGMGITADAVTWGKMLNLARSNFSAWWMALLPGMAIFLTIAVFNRLGDVLDTQITGQQEI